MRNPFLRADIRPGLRVRIVLKKDQPTGNLFFFVFVFFLIFKCGGGNAAPGLRVRIVLKKDQPTGNLTEGYVKDILTNAPVHTRGIKVRLADGQIGRVKEILE